MSSEEKSDLLLSQRSVTAPTSWLVRSYNLVQILTFDVTTRGLTSILMTEGLLCRIRASIVIHVMVSPILVSSNRHAESPRKRPRVGRHSSASRHEAYPASKAQCIRFVAADATWTTLDGKS
ncbi:SAM-dependent methyltransferase-like protein [Alternaria alternata]|nr:SAM-dependent methyltransferase-like protein [Alternaria alternata]